MARLEVLGSSTKVGDGAATDFEVVVRTPPDARIVAPVSAPVGADVTFDGSGSVDGDMPIRTLTWHFNDGAVLQGETVSRTFDKPGRYLVALTADDGSAQPCGADTTEVSILLNAPPVAVPGPDHRVSVGESVAFDAARSFDTDGRITAFAWDFGDGSGSSAAGEPHAYASPGTYTARLTVTDNSGLPNATASATTTIIVNAPPLSVAGARQDGGGRRTAGVRRLRFERCRRPSADLGLGFRRRRQGDAEQRRSTPSARPARIR